MFGDWSVLHTRINEHDTLLREWKHQAKTNKWKIVIIGMFNKNSRIFTSHLNFKVSSLKWILISVEIGAGTAIPTVRMESEDVSRKFNATLIRINPEDPKINDAAPNMPHYSITDGAESALVKIDKYFSALSEKK